MNNSSAVPQHSPMLQTGNVTLHAAPDMRTVMREQVSFVFRALRLEARVIGVVLAIVTVVIVIAIATGTAGQWFDAGDWLVIGQVALVFPFAIWRRDRRFAPAFLWTLPVNRTRLVYARVFAGWVWLMTALLAFVAWKFALSLFSGLDSPRILSFVAPIGVTALYLIGSSVLLALRFPLRWFLGAAGVLLLLGLLERGVAGSPYAFELLLGGPQLVSIVESLSTAWQRLPRLAQALIPNLVALAIGLVAVRAAASRHAESRRL